MWLLKILCVLKRMFTRGIEMWYCVFKKPADWYCKHGQKADSWDNRPPGSLKLGNPNSDIHRLTPPWYISVQKYTDKINKCFLSLSVKSLHLNIKNQKWKVKSLALLSAKETDGEGKHHNKTSTRKPKHNYVENVLASI